MADNAFDSFNNGLVAGQGVVLVIMVGAYVALDNAEAMYLVRQDVHAVNCRNTGQGGGYNGASYFDSLKVVHGSFERKPTAHTI